MKGVIFARVSSSIASDRQRTERQVADLTSYANRNDITIIKIFSENISGATKNEKRQTLIDCKKFCLENSIDVILCSEMSRLSRNIYELQDTIKWAHDNKVNVFFQKESVSLFDKEGRESLIFPVLLACIGFCAETERQNIQFRLNSGRKLAKEKGVKMGRPVGSKNRVDKKEKYKDAIHLLQKGNSIRDVAKFCNISTPTVQSLKKEFCNINN